MEQSQKVIIDKWILEVWNHGDCRFDFDIHIDEIEENALSNTEEWLSKALGYFIKIEELKKNLDVDLHLILKIPLNDKTIDLEQIILEDTELLMDLDKTTPPSFFLINNFHLNSLINKGKKVLNEVIPKDFYIYYFECFQEGFPEYIYRHLYLWK